MSTSSLTEALVQGAGARACFPAARLRAGKRRSPARRRGLHPGRRLGSAQGAVSTAVARRRTSASCRPPLLLQQGGGMLSTAVRRMIALPGLSDGEARLYAAVRRRLDLSGSVSISLNLSQSLPMFRPPPPPALNDSTVRKWRPLPDGRAVRTGRPQNLLGPSTLAPAAWRVGDSDFD